MTGTPLGPQSSKAWAELQELFRTVRTAGRDVLRKATAPQREAWAHAVATLLRDEQFNIEQVGGDLAQLKPLVIADAVAAAWPDMTESQRNAYRRWVRSLPTDKSSSQVVGFLPVMAREDPASAVDFLQQLSLDNRENRERLLSLLDPDILRHIVPPEAPEHLVRKILRIIIQIATQPKANEDARFRSAAFVATTIATRNLARHLRDLQTELGPLVETLPEPRRRALIEMLTTEHSSASELSVEMQREVGASAALTPEPTPPSTPASDYAAKGKRDDVSDQIAAWIEALQGPLNCLQAAQREIRELRSSCSDLQQQLAATESEKHDISRNLESERTGRGTAEARLQDASRRFEQAQMRLTQLESDLAAKAMAIQQLTTKYEEISTEREQLLRRVEANASARLAEFRRALGSSLSRTFGKLPQRGSAVTVELGQVLLTRLHEIATELERNDVPLKID